MGTFNDDGSWTSNKGKRYGPNDHFTDEADSQENAADQATKLNPGPFSDPNSAQGNTVVGNRLGSNTPGGQLNTGPADLQRNQQSDLLASLQQQAATGSGEWEKTLDAGMRRAQATASAIGQSNPSTDYGSALSNIGNAQAGAAQRAVGQGNVLRAESEQSAQDELSRLLEGQGRQDIDQAAAQSGAAQGLRETNLQLKQAATKTAGNYASGIGQGVGAVASMSDGGRVPGEPEVFGDDSRNDTVHALLSPKEIVVPISASTDPDKAAAFARAVAMRNQPQRMADGGDVSPYETERNRAWQPGDPDPTGPKPNTFDLFGAYGDVQTPSVQNGGLLDESNFAQTRAAGLPLAEMLRQRAAGGGPSVTGQQIQNANDDSISGAMNAQRSQRMAAATATAAATQAAQAGAGEAAAAKGKEQEAGQSALTSRLSTARQQELQLAQAQQQAEMRNTQTNLGIGAADQAAIHGLLSGGAQAAQGFAGASSKNSGGTSDTSKWDSSELADVGGDRGGAADLSASDPESKAHGGLVGVMDDDERTRTHRFLRQLGRKAA